MSHSRIEMDQITYRKDSQDGLSIDVAIVGAGVSGLYTGYRMLTGDYTNNQCPPSSVHIFEMNDHIGGRLQSIKLPEMDVVGELGGMHYMTSHQITTALIEDVFQLPHTPFQLGDPAEYIYYLRGQRFQGTAWDDAQAKGQSFDTHYHLNETDQGYRFDQLLHKVVYRILMADPWFVENYKDRIEKVNNYEYVFRITNWQWDDIKQNWTYYKQNSPYDSMKVRDIGFWNLIKDQIGQEGYSFIADAEGYYSNTMNWNAAVAISYMIGDFSEDATYRTIETGYDQLAYRLAQQYSAMEGSQLWLGNQLVTFEKTPHGKRHYRLTFLNQDGEGDWTVEADKIVLAMPKRSLELLDQRNFFFRPAADTQLLRYMDSVFSIPSFKLLMGFKYPWWTEKLGVTAGKAITDLPMSQCYYFGTDPRNSHALLLASYNDMRTVHFWNSLIQRESLQSIKNDGLRMTDQASYKETQGAVLTAEEQTVLPGDPAPQHVVDEALNQVKELHGKDIPAPYTARIKDWSRDPYGGGYHNWRVGVAVHEVIPYMRQPYTYESVHIVGDAYSGQQGWVEGALCVSEKLLQGCFHLEWPSWLDKDHYLGL